MQELKWIYYSDHAGVRRKVKDDVLGSTAPVFGRVNTGKSVIV